MFILPPRTPRITFGELQRKVASWGHQVSEITITMPTNYLEGLPEKSLPCYFTTNVSAAKSYWNFDWNCAQRSVETKM